MLTRSQTREREELLGLQQDIFMAELNERAAEELSEVDLDNIQYFVQTLLRNQ